MGHDVFISHAATDKVIADEITNSLESGGVRCWVAPRDIRPGDTWGGSIVTAIENCSIMVVLFSDSSNKSRQVLREVERAVQKNVVVLPFRIDEVEPTGDMEYFLSATHWLDALVGDMEMHYTHLLQTTLSILEREALETDSPKTEPTTTIAKPEKAKPAPAPVKKVKKKAAKPKARVKAEPLLEKEPLAKKEPVAENNLSPAAKPEAPIAAESETLETISQIEWASALEADHEEKSKSKPTTQHSSSEASATENIATSQNKLARATDKIPDQEPPERNPSLNSAELTGTPELMIEGARNRREVDKPKLPSKKWLLIAVSTIPVIAAGAWFLLIDQPFNSETKESVVSVVKPSDSKKVAPAKSTTKEAMVKATVKKLIPKKSSSEPAPKIVEKKTMEPRTITVKERTSDIKKTADAPKRLTQKELGEIARKKSEEEQAQHDKVEAQRLAAKKAAAEKAHNALIAKAEGGDISAQLKLAQMYQTGKSAKRSITQAERWFAKAAEAGNADAQYELSQILANGRDGKRNQGAAVSWLIKAANQNNLLAQTQLAERYSSGSGIGQSDVDAVQWYRRAANLGDLEAQKNLATLYEFGIGTNKDLAAALKWYKAAANQGDRSSTLYVQKLLEKDPSLNRQADISQPNTSSNNPEANTPPSG